MQLRDPSSLVAGYTFLERWLVESHTTVPFDNRVFFVSLLNYAEFSHQFSEVAKALDAISGIKFLTGRRGSASGGLFARSESGVAPGYDRGGWGTPRTLGTGLFVVWGIVQLFLSERPEPHSFLRLFISPSIETA